LNIASQPCGWKEIVVALIPSEMGKGCESPPNHDVLPLSDTDIVRIHETIGTRNKEVQRSLEKVGFRKEGKMRKSVFFRRLDWELCSIVREG